MSDEIRIHVHPETVPTTSAPFHPTTTHVDSLGMPVVMTQNGLGYHPTPCCGASASINDGPMYCKRCYGEVDAAFGNCPVEPFREVAEVVTGWAPLPEVPPLPSKQPPLGKTHRLVREKVIREASDANRQYPQYDGHWDGDEWILVCITNEIGGSFQLGDLTIARQEEGDDYVTAYSWRTRIDTGINGYDFSVVGEGSC